MTDEPFLTVGTPLFLLTGTERCWKSHRLQPAVALATRALRDGELDTFPTDNASATDDGEPFLLSNIVER